MRSTIRAAVCVPVRNERRLLPCLVETIARQRDVDRGTLVLCCHFDACDDGSEDVARHAAARLGVAFIADRSIGHGPPNAGRARRAAVALGCAALGQGDGILLTTDADSIPRGDWTAAATRALAFCDVVAGRIVRDDAGRDSGQARVEAYYDRLYALRRAIDPVPWEAASSHHYTGGANLGFRLAAYRALGGFRELASGEDAVMVDDAGRAGLRVRRDAALVVRTSARRHGRAPDGLAAALRQLDRGAGARLCHPRDAVWQYERHAAARAGFARLADRATAAALAARLGLPIDHLLGVARDCPNAEAFAMRIVPAAPGGGRLVSMAEAEQALDRLEQRPEAQVA